MSITHLTATELRRQLAAGELSSVDVTRAYLDRIAAVDDRVRAFLTIDPERSIEQARCVDERRRRGEDIGCLQGIPIAVKDVLCTQGQKTTCASRMLENYRPPFNCTVVEKLASAGGVVLGKTNLDEFAMGSSTENSAWQQTCNPWNLSRVPGGSSGGAAAAVAGTMAPLSVGTDTGGSIRQPASLCGVVGLKPTYGRVSRFGLIAFASSLDQIGPLAWTVEDTALLLQAIAGHDERDSTSADHPVPLYSQTVTQPLAGLRLGVAREHFDEGLDEVVAARVKEAVDVYRTMGATIKDISLPHSRYAISAYYIIAPSEASSNLARYDGAHYGYRTDEQEMLRQMQQQKNELESEGDQHGLDNMDTPLVQMYRRTRAEGFGAEVKRRIMLGTYALSSGYYDAYYLKALKVRRLIRQDYDRAFEEVDFIVGPVSPTPAFELGAMTSDPLALYLQDLYTVSANLAGITAISLPCGFSADELPVGLQLQGAPFDEDRLLRAAHMYQRETDWHARRPSLS